IGLSLAIAALPRAMRVRAIGQVLAVIPAVIGLSRLVALLGGPNAGLDQVLFSDKIGTADFGRPNVMAPNTAVNFVLLGVALIMIDRGVRRRARWLAQLLALVAAMSSLLALLGYAYGLSWFYGLGGQIAMALPTAATFLIAATGVLCARPAQGMMAVV